MIPVVPQPEPAEFDKLVRQRGKNFLSKFTTTKPTTKQWTTHAYWNNIQSQFYEAYKGICAYSAHWIPRSDNPNIDHYIPKSVDSTFAYEWSNYRLACPLVNAFKKDFQDALDPFTIGKDWFILRFPFLVVKPNPSLSEQDYKRVNATIERLKLNDDKFVNVRSSWLKRYCLGETNFLGLRKVAPFIAYELERQKLTDEIKKIMDYSQDIEEDYERRR